MKALRTAVVRSIDTRRGSDRSRTFDASKYLPYQPLTLPDRTWPNRVLERAPRFCAVDLRDGNQALPQPMSVEAKLALFERLIAIGFKEIEVGFPASSSTEFQFVRRLIEEDRIPEDVTIQVLTQARPHIIERTFEALEGVPRAIVHVYNSTSRVQREQVFRASREAVKQIAVDGARRVKEEAARRPGTHWIFQYSPESFSGTEPDYAVEVVNAVLDVWRPDLGQDVIVNLPATVEMTTPNIFADQVEYFCRHVKHREHISVSLHTHNDRGCAVAAAELGVLAGADRVEGTLFGNGERTGNMCLVTFAMNLYSRGIDPRIDLSDMTGIVETYERTTGMSVHPRHPWAGELVYAAFSGSHQDAIRKSMAYHREHDFAHWEVAYLPIDPRDIGRTYDEVVRINSQSGKGGVALVLERDWGVELPKWLHPVLSEIVQREAERTEREVSSERIWQLFDLELVAVPEGWRLLGYQSHSELQTFATFRVNGLDGEIWLTGRGQGLVEALVDGLERHFKVRITVEAFEQHTLRAGTDANALASVRVLVDGVPAVACWIDENTAAATLQAVLSAVGRALRSLGNTSSFH